MLEIIFLLETYVKIKFLADCDGILSRIFFLTEFPVKIDFTHSKIHSNFAHTKTCHKKVSLVKMTVTRTWSQDFIKIKLLFCSVKIIGSSKGTLVLLLVKNVQGYNCNLLVCILLYIQCQAA